MRKYLTKNKTNKMNTKKKPQQQNRKVQTAIHYKNRSFVLIGMYLRMSVFTYVLKWCAPLKVCVYVYDWAREKNENTANLQILCKPTVKIMLLFTLLFLFHFDFFCWICSFCFLFFKYKILLKNGARHSKACNNHDKSMWPHALSRKYLFEKRGRNK